MRLLSHAGEADAALTRLRTDLAASRAILEGELIEPDAPGAAVVVQKDPFARAHRINMPIGATLQDAINASRIGPRLHRYIHAYVDGVPIPRSRWAVTRPSRDEVVLLRVEMAGGDDGKNPLRAILAIALTIVSFGIGGAAASAFGFAAGTTGYAITQAVVGGLIMTAGQALLNQLIPPPKPPGQKFAFDQQPGNPYAMITGLNNRPGNWQPIPRIVGKRRIYPMLAAKPYTESQGSTQYVRMLLLAGYGPLQITDLRIGNTPISAFAGAQVEIREGWDDDDPVTLYTRTIEEEGLSIELEPNIANTRTTEDDCREVSIDIVLPQGLGVYDSNGNLTSRTVAFTVQYRLSGSGGAWSNAVWIEGGSQYGTGSNGAISATASSADAEVRSGRFALPSAGQYDIRVTRSTAAGTAQTVDKAYWTVLRSIKQDSPINMDGLCLIALRLKASKQLNGAPDTINCVAESYLPVWDDSAEEWNYQLTRNPAWEYIDVLRRRGTKQLIADDRFNMPQFLDWADACDADPPNAEDEPYHACDLVFEGGSAYSAAQAIAAHGRAQFSLVDGKYGIVRDAEQTVPVMHISPRNSWGYRGGKAFVDVPHALRAQFINPNQDYAQDEVIVFRDGYNEHGTGGKIAASKYETLEFMGCTSPTQAWRDTRYHFGVLLLRPEEHSVSMDIEALRCTKGDLVRFSHDVISIGLGHGRLSGRTINAGSVTHFRLDSPVSMADGVDYALRIRHLDGSSTVHPLVGQDDDGIDTVELVTPVLVGAAAVAGDLFQFGQLDLETAPMIVARIERGENLTARVVMVDAQPGVWTADGGEIPAFNTNITTPVAPSQKQPATPTFSLRSDDTAVLRHSDGTLIERISVSLSPPRASDVALSYWEVRWRESDSTDGEFRLVSPIPMDRLTVFLTPIVAGRQYDIGVRTVSAAGRESDWQTSSGYEAEGLLSIPPDVTSFTATPQVEGCELNWVAVDDPNLRMYKIRRGADWDSGTDVADVVGTRAFVALPDFTTFTFHIKAINKVGNESANAASVTATSLLGDLFEPFDATDIAAAITDLWTNQENLGSLVSQLRLGLDSLGYTDGIPVGTVIIEEQRQRIEGDAQIAEVISLIGAKTGDNSAFILDVDTVMAAPGESLATRFSTISSTLGDHTASISTLESVTDGLEALYTLKLDVNGRVTGMYLKATNTTTDFVFVADKFIIIDPSHGLNSPFVPFAVSGGVVKMPNVEVDTFKANSILAAAIAAGQINAAHMNVSSLSAITATIGLLRTASTGARTEIEDNQIRVYDSSNNMRVRIGVW